MSFLAACPQPQLVMLKGEPFLVQELRLRDIAYLEGMARNAIGDPLEELKSLEGADRRAKLRELFDMAENGTLTPSWGSGDAMFFVFLSTTVGQTAYLSLALRAHEPDRNDARAVEHWNGVLESLARPADEGGLSEDEWKAVFRASSPTEHLYVLDAMILDEIEANMPPPEKGDVTWSSIIGEMCDGDPLKLNALLDMTVGQVGFLRSKGEPPQIHRNCPSGWNKEQHRQFLIKLEQFWAEGKQESSRG